MEPEPKARAPERALRQYLAHALEPPPPPSCTRSAGCLDRFLAKGLDNFPPSSPLKAKPSRCLLFEQLLSGCRRKQERLLVPDLATNWFRKQKVYADKLSAEELAALSSGLASRDESHCLEERKCPEQLKRCPEADGLLSECLPTTGPKSRNPFLLDSGATLEERQTNCFQGLKETTKESSRDCLSPRRTEPMLNRRRNDLRKAPHRRLDPAAFRRISPEFFGLLDAYETAMCESCPLYGISMDHWDERKASSVEEEAWQKQHCLGDEAVATAVVSPYRLTGQNSKPPEEEEEEEEEVKQLEKASSKWREDAEEREDKQDVEDKVMQKERRNSKMRRVSLASQETQQEQEWNDVQPCNSDTCSARGEMVSFCSYQERPGRRNKSQRSLSNYSSVRSGYDEVGYSADEKQRSELQQKQEQLKQQQEQLQLEQQEKHKQLKQQQEQLQMELQEKQEQLKKQQEQLKQQQEQLEQQQQQLQGQLEGTNAAVPKRPSKTPKKRRCNWCSCFRPSTAMQFRNSYSNAYLPGLHAQAPPKPRLPRTPSLPPTPLPPNLYLMPHQRVPPTASSLYTPLSSGCTLCSASNRKKHILGGLTGLCKRVTNPGRHLLYNLGTNMHHNRAKYAKKQPSQPKRHLSPQEGLNEAGVPQLFISTPAPCTWKKVKRKLPVTDQAMEMQAEDSTTTLKPSVYEEEQQPEELPKLTSDQSLNFHTPPSECTLAGFPQLPGDSRSSVSCEQVPAGTSSIIRQCECDWSSTETQDNPNQAAELQQESGYNHQGQPARSRKSKHSQDPAYLPNETQEADRTPKLTMPRRQSLYTLHPFSGYRPRGFHWGTDYQQLMQRVARPRLNRERLKRKKPADQVAPKTKPKPRGQSQAKPKPTPKPKPKTKLKPKPKVATSTTAPAQDAQDPQPTNDDEPPRLCSRQSSINPNQICRRQSTETLLEDLPAAQPEPSNCGCQNQAESPMISEQSSLDFISCVTTSKSQDQRGIPSSKSHSDTESQTVTEQSSLDSMVCKCTQQEEIPQKNTRKCAAASTSTLSEEPSRPKRRLTCRSPGPRRRERKPNSYQALRSPEQPSRGRTTSCGSSSSGGRMQRERSSCGYRQFEASACHRPKRCQDHDRPCNRKSCHSTKTREVSMASVWSQRRRRPFCSPWADYERSHQSLHSKASSGSSCWPPQESRQDASLEVPSLRSSFWRRCLPPNQWLPPAMAGLSSGHASFETPGHVYNYAPMQPVLSFGPTQLETSFEAAQPSEHITRGRRYYTETQPDRATGNKFSCRSMHTTCSIRALSSNTDSLQCPCAPAPSVASVEPPASSIDVALAEEEVEEEEEQQYYRYQEPCTPPPPASGFKTSFLKDTMRWEEQEHRYTRTRLRTNRPPPDAYYPSASGNNSFYRPQLASYHRWDNDSYCQPGQESFPDARPRHQPYAYFLGHQGQPDFNSLNEQRADREGAIAAAAQGLRGLVQAMGGPRHRSRHSRCSLESCYQPQAGRSGSSCLCSDWLGHQPHRESPTSGSYYSRGSGATERTWSSREASAARFSRGSTAKRSVRERRRGFESGAFTSFGSGMDFHGEPLMSQRTMCSRSRRRRTGGSSRVKKVENEMEEKPTALAIFLDELKAKHDATQSLSQGRSPPEIKERACRERLVSSSEDCAEPSKRMAIPTTYTGLLEEQIINEYLPRPRYKRRT